MIFGKSKNFKQNPNSIFKRDSELFSSKKELLNSL